MYDLYVCIHSNYNHIHILRNVNIKYLVIMAKMLFHVLSSKMLFITKYKLAKLLPNAVTSFTLFLSLTEAMTEVPL